MPHMFTRTPRDQEIVSVTADGACEPRRCYQGRRCRGSYRQCRL
jgi:hypothetical protein